MKHVGDVGFMVLVFCGHLGFEHFLRRRVDDFERFGGSCRYHVSFRYHGR